MAATVFFQGSNELAVLGNTFTVAGVNTDPTTVSCVITDPTGTAVTHTFAGASPADITKTSTGVYKLQIPCTITGLWGYVWTGTGAVSDVQAGTWPVNPVSLHQFYTSVEEIKDRLGITDTASDLQLELAVMAAARAIEGMCGRFFYQVAETRTYKPYDIYELPVDDLVSVTTLKCDQDNDGVYEQTWTQGVDFQLVIGEDEFAVNASGESRPYSIVRAISAGGGKIFPFTWEFSRLDPIQITGVWGWPAVPYAVKMAAQQVAGELFKLKDSPFGIAGTSEFGTVRLPRAGNPYITRLLCPYINPRRKVGV